MSFGEKIKQLRLEKAWTQEYVASRLNISVGALSRYESSMYEPKSLNLLKDFSELFDVTTDYLLGNTDIRKFDLLNLCSEDIKFIKSIKKLDETNKMIIKNTMEALLDKQEKDEKK